VSNRVPEYKLKKLGLTPDATQWELIKALAVRNAGNTDAEEKMGLMEAERREYCIIAPSHFAISNAIAEDLRILREERWPYTRGGRMKVIGVPQPSAAGAFAEKPAMTKAQMLLIQHTARQKEEMEKKRAEEQEKLEKTKKVEILKKSSI
jgi:phosphopantetheinyl transferase (holo-ACP synthase)